MTWERLLVDEIMENARKGPWPPRTGKIMTGHPIEMEINLNYTGLRGSGATLFRSLIYKLPKLAYHVSKVDEWMEVNPNFPEIHGQMMEAKHKLEGSIKSGLASAMQAITDYELISHDYRRYKEIVEYFKKGREDEHVLRSLFVDRVDAHTGDMFSMIGMAKRWPTIIADFMKMKNEWTDPGKTPAGEQLDKIRKELDVSQAEATVLKTKNELYNEWKQLFRPVVLERYARLENLIRARKKSIEEYRNWLKPYLAKYKAMREATEGTKPEFFVSNVYSTPAFSTQESLSGVRLWIYRPFYVTEKGMPSAVVEEGKNRGFMVDPYDRDWAQKYHRMIEEHYGVKVDLEAALRELSGLTPHNRNDTLYFVLFDIKTVLSLTSGGQPDAVPQDDLTYDTKLWVLSLNAMLIFLMEKQAREKRLVNYMNELVGMAEDEESIIYKLRKEMGDQLAPEEMSKIQEEPEKKRLQGLSNVVEKARPVAEKFWEFFVKPGPYEVVFFERASKMYMRAAGFYWKQITDHIKGTMGIE
jgi:hypothetical protein